MSDAEEIEEMLASERPRVDTLTSTINRRNTPMLRVCGVLGFREVRSRYLVEIHSRGVRRTSSRQASAVPGAG